MTELTGIEKAIVFLDSTEGLEYKYKKTIIDNFKGDLFKDRARLMKFFEDRGERVLGKSLAEMLGDESYAEKRVAEAISGADDVITIASVGEKGSYYPESLRETPVPPLALYVKGDKELLKEKHKISIVGSRKTLPQYLSATEKIARELSENGAVVVTGIADGADGAAIKGALPSGRIISVQASGVYPVMPASKQNLANEIAKNGLLISENPKGYVPRSFSYPVRNRIIAALSPVTLIASGNAKSGAKYTADYAADYGREIACFPYGLGVASGELCKSLVKSGAAMIENTEEAAFLMRMTFEKKPEIQLNEVEKAVYKSIKSGINSTDALALKLGFKIYELLTITVSLEMKGLIVKGPDGRFEAN